MDEEVNFNLNESDIKDEAVLEEESEVELARRGARQTVYKLRPSNQYVLYVAMKNAEQTWAKDGGRNRGCLEVQIALLTERIRNMVLHMRDFRHDYKCRLKLVQMVARRRRYLDKLSWKDLDSYLKIRNALKIRHAYRMEALIGRLPLYRYSLQDRKMAPGRKVSMRLKKSKKLLNRRLAAQLQQGKDKSVIHATRKKLNSRKWMSAAYDEAEYLVQGREPQEFLDPLDLP